MKISEADRELDEILSRGHDEREAVNIKKIFWEDLFNYKGGIDRALHTREMIVFRDAMRKLERGLPIQYVTEIAFFYNYRFEVNEAVLIPRPETEELVYKMLSDRVEGKVLDIGTGSGCIAVTIKCRRPNCDVEAIDVSSRAIEVAKRNAEKHDATIKFQNLDFLDEKSWFSLERYDVIISNPPYISRDEISEMSISTLEHEPAVALFPEDEDVLIFYKKIAAFGKDHILPGGKIYLECNEFNALEVKALFQENGYEKVEIEQDLQGKNRMIIVG
ncbi:peptide chain release factor N(5)-glutamine methyltransferase [Portibacter marinus]|uniref:peptide chain release factor N(5)-glutamine methyltransferase n=1 Tax=Portibacter marinus TaxID=2898660 RepID=UPI001F2AF878|nr:peptide chain release factor N(5)-glutamine methyltransferase [Portibacter marinus]